MAPLNAKNFIWVFFISMLFNAGCASTLNPGYWEFVPVTTTPPGAKLVIFGEAMACRAALTAIVFGLVIPAIDPTALASDGAVR